MSFIELLWPARKLIDERRSRIIGKQQAMAATGHPNIYSLSNYLTEYLILGFRSGILRVINGRTKVRLNIVPVDMVAEHLIREAFRESYKDIKRPNTHIIFSISIKERSLSLGEAYKLLKDPSNSPFDIQVLKDMPYS